MGDWKAIELCGLGDIEVDHSRFKTLWCSDDDVAYLSNPCRGRCSAGPYQEASPDGGVFVEYLADCVVGKRDDVVYVFAMAGQNNS